MEFNQTNNNKGDVNNINFGLIDAQRVWLLYRNHRGEVAWRCVTPHTVRFGSEHYHPAVQWFLEVYDHERKAVRTYALADVLMWRATPPTEELMAVAATMNMLSNGGAG